MRISAVTSALVLGLVLFAHPALCQGELPAIGDRSTNTDGRISLRVEAPQGKAIFLKPPMCCGKSLTRNCAR